MGKETNPAKKDQNSQQQLLVSSKVDRKIAAVDGIVLDPDKTNSHNLAILLL
jgi:hypothetical protein